jgi:hypothetical protein
VQSQSPLPLAKVILTLIWEDDSLQDGKPDRPIECRLTFQVTPEQYQQIDTQALFNLKPEIRGAAPTADFQPDRPIQITASLKPGEIRYKTSINVEGDRLSPTLIKRLVYTNVAMMDEYLPGIKAVIKTEVSPEEAIRAIEQVSTNTPVEG